MPPETESFYSGRYLIVGPPGTGKTTHLSAQTKRIVERYHDGPFSRSRWPNPVLVCSLTRAAAAEVAGRGLPISPRCIGTLHAHCYRALDGPDMVDQSHVAEWNEQYDWPMSLDQFGRPRKSKKNDAGEDSDDSANEIVQAGFEPVFGSLGDKMLNDCDMRRHKLERIESWPLAVQDFHHAWTEFKTAQGIFDFTDLIEVALATVEDPPFGPAVMLVDEAQDLSRLEYTLVCRWGDRCAAIILVGDPRQSLYTWRGADPTIFDDPNVEESHRHVLRQSYRVPRRVLHASVRWVEEYLSDYRDTEYFPRKEPIVDEPVDGDIGTRPYTLSNVEGLIDEAEDLVDTGRSVMFQASCSYMLNNLIARMRDRAIPFGNPWRESNGQWNPTLARGPLSGMNRVLAFVRNCTDMEVDHREHWTRHDVCAWASAISAKSCLVRGAKSIIASWKDDESLFASDHSDWHVFLPEHHDFLYDVLTGQVRSDEALAWYSKHVLASHAKSIEYALRVVEQGGPDALASRPMIYVGTIHSFKGAEADVTFIFPDLSAAGFRQWMLGESPERDEVVRLFYVALTRAKERAYVCTNDSNLCAPLRREVSRYSEEFQ